MEIWSFAQEYLEKLRDRLGESTSMSVLDGHDVVYVMRAQARRILTSHLAYRSAAQPDLKIPTGMNIHYYIFLLGSL